MDRIKKKYLIFIVIIFLFLVVFAVFFGKKYYDYIFSSNVKISADKEYIYIPTGSNFEDVCKILDKSGFIKDINSFRFVAERKKYTSMVKPGRYEIKNGMSNNELVNLLRSGKQSPVKLSFISVRSLDILAGRLAKFVEPDSVTLINLLKNPATADKYGFSVQNFMAMFIPNTYEVYWNINAEKLLDRFYDEYKKFWTEERINKAESIGLSILEVSVLASIVEAETQKNDEKPRIAGVYINRLRQGMLLQADPTVIYAIGDFSIKRVLNKHLEIESPYNTYKFPGLPPGPINIPSISSIDAVLNYEKHNYMYFCAKADFSGYHEFAVTLAQHERNARKYRDALRKSGIR